MRKLLSLPFQNFFQLTIAKTYNFGFNGTHCILQLCNILLTCYCILKWLLYCFLSVKVVVGTKNVNILEGDKDKCHTYLRMMLMLPLKAQYKLFLADLADCHRQLKHLQVNITLNIKQIIENKVFFICDSRICSTYHWTLGNKN